MLIKLNDDWYVEAALVSSVRYYALRGTVDVYFNGDKGFAAFKGPQSEVKRIVDDVNRGKSEKE